MSATVRTATLLPFAAAPARRVPLPAARATRRAAPPSPAPSPRPARLPALRRVAAAAGLCAMLLASVGATGWAFVAAGHAVQSSLDAYVAAPGGGS